MSFCTLIVLDVSQSNQQDPNNSKVKHLLLAYVQP